MAYASWRAAERDPSRRVFVFQKNLDKASTFTDTEVSAAPLYKLIQISSDGDLSDITYKVTNWDNVEGPAILAEKSPHIPGPIRKLTVSNTTAEAGKTVYVTMYNAPDEILALIKHGTPASTLTVAPQTPIVEKGSILNTSKAINTDWFAANISPTKNPCIHRLMIRMTTTSVVRVEMDDGATTDLELDVNAVQALTARGVYIFDIIVLSGQSWNIQHATATQAVFCSVIEMYEVTG